MTVDVSSRVIVRYPWVFMFLVGIIVVGICIYAALVIYDQPSMVPAVFIITARGLLGWRRKIEIFDDHIRYQPAILSAKMIEFGRVTAIKKVRTNMDWLGGFAYAAAAEFSFGIDVPVVVPLDLPAQKSSELFELLLNKWTSYQELHSKAIII